MLPNCLRVCHQTLSPSGQRDGAQQGRYSLTGSNKDPMDPESVPLPSVQAWPRILPAVPFLLVCVHGIWVTLALHVPRSPFCWQTLEELLSFPLCLSWNNWSRHRRSRCCFFLCPWCSIPSESCQFTCAAPVFAWAL